MKELVFLREIVARHLVKLAETDEKIIAVNADLAKGCRMWEFVEKYPCRSFDVGIAEQNMVSFSAGLALEGFTPFAFSFAPFISMRACEQCRTDVAYGNLKVRLMSCYSGVSGGISGTTHWGLEDVGIMTAIPNMTVIEFSDGIQAEKLLTASQFCAGPIYFRITVNPVDKLYDDMDEFEIGKASVAREGNDGAYICSGVTVSFAVRAADEIADVTGKEIRVLDMHTIKPIDRGAIVHAAETGVVLVAQDHNVIGGLGQQVATVVAEDGLRCRFAIAGIPDRFDAMARSPVLHSRYGYGKDELVEKMMTLLRQTD